jgi:tartrate dehydrogenase/decarboxylase/D-malate dehydrogenase
MKTYKIGVIPGDGIGKEVIPEGKKVLNALGNRFGLKFEYTDFPWGTEYYFSTGKMMPENGLELLKPFDAIFFGAVGDPKVPDHITLHGLILPIRRGFDQYACERPSYLYEGVSSPLVGKKPGDIDLIVIRENTEGEYAPIGGHVYLGTPEEVAVQTAVFTRRGCERVIRYAFELARRRNKKKWVTSITKSNAQGFGMVLWDRTFREVTKSYPDIKTDSLLVDAACMDFVRRPEHFDVVVASNLFGDILTDIGAIITGSMGLAPSANLNPERRFPSMFEPVHGSAPDIYGKGIANPMATIMSARMMLDFLSESEAARILETIIKKVLADTKVRTPDLGGKATTREVGDTVVELINEA